MAPSTMSCFICDQKVFCTCTVIIIISFDHLLISYSHLLLTGIHTIMLLCALYIIIIIIIIS